MLSRIFDEHDSLFHMQYKCLNIKCWYSELFKINEISKDIFKCLIFVQGLIAPKDKDICSRLLTIMGQNLKIILQKVTEECQRLINIKYNNARIEEKISHMHKG